MIRWVRRVLVTAILIGTAACDGGAEPSAPNAPDPDPEPTSIRLTEVVTGLDQPTALAAPAGDPRTFVAEQPGAIRIIENGELAGTPFLDLSDRTRAQGEQGLLGLVFHPEYGSNGRFFVNYTDLTGDTRIVEYRVSEDGDRADPESASELLLIEQPHGNHNGGDLGFGPDGMLYVSTGDGGGSYDPLGHGQNVETLHGAILRLDVSTPGRATIPPDNPFAGRPEEGAGELWAWGLRNPWRISFDLEEERIYIADVGQGRWEEVNVAPAGEGGLNYGWAVMEGPECVDSANCDTTGLVEPALAYPHPEGCSIIGGAVYRGERLQGVDGHYFFSDLCARFLRSFRYENGEVLEERMWEVEAPAAVGSMGRDGAGEIYILTRDGKALRLDPDDGS